MLQRSKRTDSAHDDRVPAPRLARQLAEAAVAKSSDVSATELPGHVRMDIDADDSGCHELPHVTELQVRRHLLDQNGLTFSSLVVRRMNNGVCLQGVVESRDDEPDFAGLVREVAAVEEVVSQIVVRLRKGDTSPE